MRRIAFFMIAICSMSLPALHAQQVNYDENKVGAYTLEDPLRFVSGKKVKNLRDWAERRQEILDIFQREMYGQMPPRSDIYLELKEQGTTLAGFGLRRQVRMWFRSDKSGPFIDWLSENALADIFFVPVALGGVDQAVAYTYGFADAVRTNFRVVDLESPESQHRHLDAVPKYFIFHVVSVFCQYRK